MSAGKLGELLVSHGLINKDQLKSAVEHKNRANVGLSSALVKLGHVNEKVLTTFLSYGEVASSRQGEIIRDLATPLSAKQSDINEIAEALFTRLRESSTGMLGR